MSKQNQKLALKHPLKWINSWPAYKDKKCKKYTLLSIRIYKEKNRH